MKIERTTKNLLEEEELIISEVTEYEWYVGVKRGFNISGKKDFEEYSCFSRFMKEIIIDYIERNSCEKLN